MATATPIAMIAPMNDWRFSGRPGNRKRDNHAGHHRGGGRNDDEGQPHRLKVGGQKQHDDDDRHNQAEGQAPEDLLERGDLSADLCRRALGRRHPARAIARSTCLATLPRSSPEMLAVRLTTRFML